MRFPPNSRNRRQMATILFIGLEGRGPRQLEAIVQARGHRVLHASDGEPFAPDAVFFDGDEAQFLRVFAAIRELAPEVPVIVVTQNPTEGKWLDAIEAGAADYCGAPFETVQVGWILD